MKLKSAISTRALYVATLMFSTTCVVTHATTLDPSLLVAFDEVWQGEHPATSALSEGFTLNKKPVSAKDGQNANLYETEVKGAPVYIVDGPEKAKILFGHNQFSANESGWGNFPLVSIEHARLLEFRVQYKRYDVISASGSGLFAVGDWQRFGFLYVLDTSSPSYFPLIAEAGLGEHVLGRLPNSPTTPRGAC
jgi:hypothetical protein